MCYDEKEYVIDAVDNDLTLLKETFDSISDGYVAKTKAYFNSLATQQINQIYKMTFYDELTTIYTNDYMYRYSEDLYVNDVERLGAIREDSTHFSLVIIFPTTKVMIKFHSTK